MINSNLTSTSAAIQKMNLDQKVRAVHRALFAFEFELLFELLDTVEC